MLVESGCAHKIGRAIWQMMMVDADFEGQKKRLSKPNRQVL